MAVEMAELETNSTAESEKVSRRECQGAGPDKALLYCAYTFS